MSLHLSRPRENLARFRQIVRAGFVNLILVKCNLSHLTLNVSCSLIRTHSNKLRSKTSDFVEIALGQIHRAGLSEYRNRVRDRNEKQLSLRLIN